MKNIIIQKLNDLNPELLEVIDESYLHKGHMENAIETHFHIAIKSKKLEGLSKIAQHRMINKLLEKELKESIHALSIEIL